MTLKVKNVDWLDAKEKLTKLREKVFVYEWRIPYQVEFDQQDPLSFHVLLYDDKQGPVATGRLTPDGELGRIAVDSSYRNQHVYKKLFQGLCNVAQHHHINTIVVQCELAGIHDYQQHGFQPVGKVFMDGGIARQKMQCPLSQCQIDHWEYTH